MTEISSDLTEENVLSSPFILMGTVAEIVEQVRGIRDRHGITYFSVFEKSANDMTPIVEQLAG